MKKSGVLEENRRKHYKESSDQKDQITVEDFFFKKINSKI